jgi:hypothetical protein
VYTVVASNEKTVNYELGRIEKEEVFACFRALPLPAKEV